MATNKELWGVKPDQKSEAEENKEAPVILKSPEVLRDQIENQAAKEVAIFQKEGSQRLEAVETRSASEGLMIDSVYKAALNGLNQEAENAKHELITEISEPSPQMPPPFTPENINAPQHVIDQYFPTPPPLPEEYRATPPPIPEEYLKVPPPPPVQAERKITPPPFPTPPPLPKEFSDVPPSPISQRDSEPPLLSKEDQIAQQPNSQEQGSVMKEREIQRAEALSAKEASKKFLAEERQKLAEQIRAERKLQRERLLSLKTAIENEISLPESADGLQEDSKFGKISEAQSAEATELSARINSSELSVQEAQEERENISNLISSSEGLRALKAKLEEHYAKADELSREQFETTRKTVEQTLLRNNVFIVHAFMAIESARHNDNSNISKRATFEDDMNILLSLEPSISTSSVMPGCKHGLWNERIGVVLGGGELMGAAQSDDGTRTGGIKKRFGKISSSHEIDEVVSDKSERPYNELVVNNPKVFGFFQNVKMDKSGNMVMPELLSNERKDKNSIKEWRESFIQFMSIGEKKGMPLLIMTPDRRLFEFVSIDESGIVTVGSEITSEQVAKGRAGLPEEKRREIGEEIVTKNLFSKIRDQQEAKEIVAELSGKELTGVELTREEYASYAKDNPGKIHDFPKHLLADKNFMMEIAQYDPISTYDLAGENLKKDIDFIKHIYSLEQTGIAKSLYSKMPEELKKDESIAILSIENNDFGELDVSLADSPTIWAKLVDESAKRANPAELFTGNPKEGIEEGQVGAVRILQPSLTMTKNKGELSFNLTNRLVSDEGFIRKLSERYPNYKFEVDPYQQILVTKLGEESI